MKITIQLQQKLVASVAKRNDPLSVGNANRDTGREFGASKTSTVVNEGIGPTSSLSKTSEFSGAVAARRGAKERPWSGITHDWSAKGSNNISGETTATPQPAISVRSTVRLKPPSVKSLQPGDSKPVSLVVIRQVGNIVKKNLAWGAGRHRVCAVQVGIPSTSCDKCEPMQDTGQSSF